MDAWSALIARSTLTEGDAWEHLQAQGGGGTGTYLILADGLEVEMVQHEIEVEMVQHEIEVAVEAVELDVEIDQSPLEVEL